MEKKILLEDEYEFFVKKKDELLRKHLESGKCIGAACEETEQTHDNPEYDYAVAEQSKYSKQISEIDNLLNSAIILKIYDIKKDTIVRIGRIVDIEVDEEPFSYMIGGYDTSGFEGRISYMSPLAKSILGKEVGDEIEFNFNGRIKDILILNIK